MIERQIEIETPAGQMTTFICHPERDGPHPAVIFYMDAPGIREELRDMARRLGTAGYYVMVPNLYYRSGAMELGPLSPDPADPSRKRMFDLMESLSISMIMQDTQVLLDLMANDPAASAGPMGAVGYCMSGQYAISAAANFPKRFAAAASVYGVRLVTDRPDSPHLVSAQTEAELYFACAQTDSWAPPEMITALSAHLAGNGAKAEVEVYAGTHHGFAFPQRPVYDKGAAERHWERLLSLFDRRLR